MADTLTALAGFAAWFVALSILLALYRGSFLLSGKPANSFAVSGGDLPPLGQRITRARDNCYETLPIFCALALVAFASDRLAVIDPMAMWVLYARIGQSLTHIASVSVPAVLLRATLFFTQVIIYAIWSLRLLS